MNGTRYAGLAAKVSYRVIDGLFAVVCDHEAGEILQLNEAGGRLLERLEQGSPDLDADDRELLEELAEIGVVERAGAEPDEPSPATEPGATAPAEPDRDLMDEINRAARDNLVPLHAQIELTHRCPLGCAHCYLGHDRQAAGNELTLAEIARLLDELAEVGCLFLLLTGGEPFSRPDLRQIYDAARDRRFAISLITSGHGAAPELLEHMATRGLDGAQVSVHGVTAAEHEALTGVPGSFEQALATLRRLVGLGVRARAAVTLTRQNVDSLPELRALLADIGAPLAINTYLQPRRDGSLEPQTLAVDEQALGRIYDELPPDERPRLADAALEDPPCGAAANVVAFDPYGGVYPCLPLRLRAGSLRESSLRDIWEKSPIFERLREMRIRDLDDCPSCELRASCNRCTAFAVAEGRGETGHSDFDCLQSRVLALK